jgi:hypothetical protein
MTNQGRDAVLESYAADIIALDARVADLEAQRDSYRELARAALDQLAASTAAQKHLRDRVAALLLEMRTLRLFPLRPAA